ncbi:MAG: cyclic nucleotide-binding domain-containing protein [Luteitalea sp.]|nr:cyclic nucleotide-binding domain-containing protein [Luteitalea sp.]
MSESIEINSGDFVFREGEAGGELYVIEEGQVELIAGPHDQRRTTLDVGDFFGERSLLDDVPREVSARALTRCRLLRLDRAGFSEIVRQSPEIAVLMVRHLSRRLGSGGTEMPSSAVFLHEASETAIPLHPQCTIGRVDRSTGVAPDVDLTPFDSDKTLSRRHAKVAMRPDGYYLREDEGRNGTFVNERRLDPGVEVRLADGDRLRFGFVHVVFRLASGSDNTP